KGLLNLQKRICYFVCIPGIRFESSFALSGLYGVVMYSNPGLRRSRSLPWAIDHALSGLHHLDTFINPTSPTLDPMQASSGKAHQHTNTLTHLPSKAAMFTHLS